MSRGERAKENFLNGCNCAQAVLLAFEDLIDLPRDALLKISQPFGAGMGRLRLTCGTVTGMMMALGLVAGTAGTGREAKNRQYAAVQELARRFREACGSLICMELLTGKGIHADTRPAAEERTAEYYKKRPCPELCRVAAEILEGYLTERGVLCAQGK